MLGLLPMAIGLAGRHAAHPTAHNARSKKTYKARKLQLFSKSNNKTQKRTRTKSLKNKKLQAEMRKVRRRSLDN